MGGVGLEHHGVARRELQFGVADAPGEGPGQHRQHLDGADRVRFAVERVVGLQGPVPQLDDVRLVRADPDGQRIRIVMLSAKGRETEVSKGLEVGADDYVTKPFSTRDLIAQVAEMLGE